MPVVVDEVVISIEVAGPASKQKGLGAAVPQTQAIIDACVEQVLEVLRQKEER